MTLLKSFFMTSALPLLLTLSHAANLAGRPAWDHSGADDKTTDHLISLVSNGAAYAGIVEELGRRNDPRILPLLQKTAEGYICKSRRAMRAYDQKHGTHSEQIPRNNYSMTQEELPIRQAAKEAAARQGDERYFNELVSNLSSTDRVQKAYSINAMRYIGDRAAIKSLIPILDNTSQIGDSNDLMSNTFCDKAMAAIYALLPANEIPPALKEPVWLTIPARDALKQWWHANQSKYGNLKFGQENIYKGN